MKKKTEKIAQIFDKYKKKKIWDYAYIIRKCSKEEKYVVDLEDIQWVLKDIYDEIKEIEEE